MSEATTEPQQIGQALRWIVSLLSQYAIPYQICGGLAAQAYGATRPLVDIDIYAALQERPHFDELLRELQPYVVRAWGPHLSASWDITYLALNYLGVPIELAEATNHPRFYNHQEGRWEDQRIDFLASTAVSVYGVDVLVMPRDELLAYKAMLDRDVDRLDLAQLTGAPGSEC
jgi:hypothetical protein